MKSLFILAAALAAASLFHLDSSAAPASQASGDVHRVLSFNIRYGSADDGLDRWELRRDKVVQTTRDLDAHVVGIQEAESFQVRELLGELPRYAAVGVHRDDGRLAGEGASILYDRGRYTLAATGTFWLSDTPEIAGSNTWGAACNRTCTWVRLVDLKSGDAFFVYNVHFDHKSQEARERSSALMVERIEARVGAGPVVIMGDLNADEENPAFTALKRGGEGWKLEDTYRLHHPGAKAGTFTGFDVKSDGGDRKIDHVLVGPGLSVRAADIDRRMIEGRYPSDHFPIWADLQLAPR